MFHNLHWSSTIQSQNNLIRSYPYFVIGSRWAKSMYELLKLLNILLYFINWLKVYRKHLRDDISRYKYVTYISLVTVLERLPDELKWVFVSMTYSIVYLFHGMPNTFWIIYWVMDIYRGMLYLLIIYCTRNCNT